MRLRLVLMAVLATLPCVTRGDLFTSFDTSAEGWDIATLPAYSSIGHNPTVHSSNAATFFATGGNPGGHIRGTEVPNFGDWFRAPSTYRGDHSAKVGGMLSFSLMASVTPINGLSPIAIVGNANTLYYEANGPAIGSWTEYSIPLSNSPTWHIDSPSGPTPTSTQFANVFSNIQALYILSDWSFNSDLTDLDTVAFTSASVPEPSGFSLLGVALLLFVLCAWKRGWNRCHVSFPSSGGDRHQDADETAAP